MPRIWVSESVYRMLEERVHEQGRDFNPGPFHLPSSNLPALLRWKRSLFSLMISQRVARIVIPKHRIYKVYCLSKRQS